LAIYSLYQINSIILIYQEQLGCYCFRCAIKDKPINKFEIIDRLIESRDELQNQGVKSLAIFGSIARGDDTPGSDVDVLVELSRPMGLFGLSDLR
jgi:hypothetical protein